MAEVGSDLNLNAVAEGYGLAGGSDAAEERQHKRAAHALIIALLEADEVVGLFSGSPMFGNVARQVIRKSGGDFTENTREGCSFPFGSRIFVNDALKLQLVGHGFFHQSAGIEHAKHAAILADFNRTQQATAAFARGRKLSAG